MNKSTLLSFIAAKGVRQFIAAAAILVLSSSCTKQIYSHEQVMQRYHTRDDIIKQFGQPDEIIVANDSTQWLYNCKRAKYASPSAKVKIKDIYNSRLNRTDIPIVVNQFSKFKRYMKLTFNKDGNILRQNTSGVNFEERKSDPVATAVLVTLSTAAVVTIYILIKNWHPTFFNLDNSVTYYDY